jgi:hypothetical protein
MRKIRKILMTNVTGSGINFARIQGTVTGAIEKMIRCEVSMRDLLPPRHRSMTTWRLTRSRH